MKYQYRVVSRRKDCRTKYVVYATEKGALNRVGLMTSSEPWKFIDQSKLPMDYTPESEICCSGYQCDCEGKTVRQYFEDRRNEYPELVECWVEKREVGEWGSHNLTAAKAEAA